MKLLSLRVHQFKGVEDFTLTPKGRNLMVFGDNATGKTTLADAFWWLLFDKDSSGRKDFEVKPLDADGQGIPEQTPTVEASLDIGDPDPLVLRKELKEKWTTKRGKAQKVFEGHETKCWINATPVSKSEYDGYIKNLINQDTFRLLTNVRYFNELLDWKGRRQVLLQLGLQVDQAAMLEAEPELKALEGTDPESEHKRVTAALKPMKQELEAMPTRIDEAAAAVDRFAGVLMPDPGFDLAQAIADRDAMVSQIAQIKAGGGAAEKTKQLREVEAAIVGLDAAHRERAGKMVAQCDLKLKVARNDIQHLENEFEYADRNIQRADDEAARVMGQLEKLAAEWEAWQAKTFDASVAKNCPTCGQSIPTEELEQAFNTDKAQNIQNIEAEGSRLKAHHDDVTRLLDQLKAQWPLLDAQMAEKKEILAAAEKALREANADYVKDSPDPQRAELVERHKALQEEIKNITTGDGVQSAVAQLQEKITRLTGQIDTENTARAMAASREQALKRVEDLRKQHKDLGTEYEKLERTRALCEKYVVVKMRMITDQINGQFSMARFKLFEVKVNGEINDQICEVTCLGVPYSDLNNGARINLGLDIINTLGRMYKVECPIFIDNAEAVSEVLLTDGQQIRMYVSGTDKKLRVM